MAQQDAVPSLVPLHFGRSFICYRDLNRAIDQHRELYGLKLTLKKSTKLENFPLTPDQLKSVNLRLKYAELDYTCSIDNGRVGRPGNDEKCDVAVRIRLSPDARTLVVCQTHVHEYSDKKGYGKPISTPVPSASSLAHYQNVLPASCGDSPVADSSHLSTSFGSLPSPSAFAASIVAAAAAAAGPSALAVPLLQQPQQQQHMPHAIMQPQQQQHNATIAGLTPSANLTILPTQFATPRVSPLSAPSANVTIRGMAGGSTTIKPAVSPNPLPGQLLIPSFYSSKSPSGHITFDSSGGVRAGTSLFHATSIRPITSFPNVSKAMGNSHGYSPHSVGPTSSLTSHEKITMKIKKSHFSPNELVVVGSARDALEQRDIRLDKSTPRAPPKKGVSTTGNMGGRINAVVANLLEKVVSNSNNSLSITHVRSPLMSHSSSSVSVSHVMGSSMHRAPISHSTAGSLPGVYMPAVSIQARPAVPASASASVTTNAGSVTSSASTCGSGGGLQVIKNQATMSRVPEKQDGGVRFISTPLDANSLRRLQERIRAKKAEKAAMKVKAKVKPLSLLHGNKPTRPVGRPIGSTNANRLAGRPSLIQEQTPSGRVSSLVSGKTVPGGVGRKLRKCRQRGLPSRGSLQQPQPTLQDCPDKLLPIDTELGEYAKQRVAQRVLVQLLRTCTQLPMVQFSHAMETIVTLVDALRLKHRVQLSILHDRDDNDGAFALLGATDDDDLSRPRCYRDASPQEYSTGMPPDGALPQEVVGGKGRRSEGSAGADSTEVPVISLVTPEKKSTNVEIDGGITDDDVVEIKPGVDTDDTEGRNCDEIQRSSDSIKHKDSEPDEGAQRSSSPNEKRKLSDVQSEKQGRDEKRTKTDSYPFLST